MCVFARTIIEPRPVVCALYAPARPIIIAPVGKSGPGIIPNNSSSDKSLLSKIAKIPLQISPRLYVGTFVAIPTAMPEPPFTKKFGNLVGKTIGSCNVPSKFGCQSTVSLSISSINDAPSFDRRASV